MLFFACLLDWLTDIRQAGDVDGTVFGNVTFGAWDCVLWHHKFRHLFGPPREHAQSSSPLYVWRLIADTVYDVIAVRYVQPPSGHASFHGCTTTSAIEASVLQAPTCGTVYHHTYDETWTLRVSSINWKHFYSGVSQQWCIVTVIFAPYLLT